MSAPSFRVAVVGPSRVGKTTLLTAVLSETTELLAGRQIAIAMDEPTQNHVRRQRKDLRRAVALGRFDPEALDGDQKVTRFHLALHPHGDDTVRIPFDLLDYPGGWLDPEQRAHNPVAAAEWPGFGEHVQHSIMLLVPIDAAVLMEATTLRQKAAADELLDVLSVEEVGRTWAMGRQAAPYEPAVVVLAPLKCEKYFDDNGGRGRDREKLRERVRERYARFREIIAAETAGRAVPVRTVYAPIDTYGCIELMEAHWGALGSRELPDFSAEYRFREYPPEIHTRAAATVMQELLHAVLFAQDQADTARRRSHQEDFDAAIARRDEPKGFFGTIGYVLSGEFLDVKDSIGANSQAIADLHRDQERLRVATADLATAPRDARVEVWDGGAEG